MTRLGLGLLLFVNSAFGAVNLDLPPNERPQVRNQILTCTTTLTLPDQIDDSVGIPFSTNSITDFESELRQTIATYGVEKFRGGTFYVMGVPMQKESEVEKQYQAVLAQSGLNEVGAKVKVLSAPSELVRAESLGLAKKVLQRLQYFFPSMKRDYQPPQWGEIMTNWQATLAVESVNVYFLFNTMPPEQAGLVVATHAIVINAYTVYTKSLLNG